MYCGFFVSKILEMKNLYLLLAVVGLCATWYFNIRFYQLEPDTSLQNFIALTSTTWPAKSISADISVVAICFMIWMIRESLLLKIKYWWLILILTFIVALAFSFPLFLYLREKALEKPSLRGPEKPTTR